MQLVKAIEAAAVAGIKKERDGLDDVILFAEHVARVGGGYEEKGVGLITPESALNNFIAEARFLDDILYRAGRITLSEKINFWTRFAKGADGLLKRAKYRVVVS